MTKRASPRVAQKEFPVGMESSGTETEGPCFAPHERERHDEAHSVPDDRNLRFRRA